MRANNLAAIVYGVVRNQRVTLVANPDPGKCIGVYLIMCDRRCGLLVLNVKKIAMTQNQKNIVPKEEARDCAFKLVCLINLKIKLCFRNRHKNRLNKAQWNKKKKFLLSIIFCNNKQQNDELKKNNKVKLSIDLV